MVSNKNYSIPNFVLQVVATAIIISVGAGSLIYSIVISKITSAGLDLQTLTIFGSILIPLTFLVFVDIIKSESWKEFKFNKIVSIIGGIFLLLALDLLFIGASLSIINAQQSVSFLYVAISISVVILVGLLPIYIYVMSIKGAE